MTTMFIQFIVSMIATLSFAVLFCAPKPELIFCGLTGAIGWIVYLICLQFDTGTVIANMVATLALFKNCRCHSEKSGNYLSDRWYFPSCTWSGNLLYFLLLYHEPDERFLPLWHGNDQGCRCDRTGYHFRILPAADMV